MWDNHRLLTQISRLMIAFSAVLLIYSGGLWLASSSRFPVQKIQIEGQLHHVTGDQLRYIVEHELKGTFFTLDLESAREAFRKLPWVRFASVRRQWPDRMVVEVEEHVPVARWGDAGLLSDQGVWFDAALDDPLPLVKGPTGSEKLLASKLNTFSKVLAAAGLKVAEIRLAPRQAWEVKLDNAIVLKLGRDEIDTRLTRFARHWTGHMADLPYNIDYVDLRYPNGFSVHMPDFHPSKSQNSAVPARAA